MYFLKAILLPAAMICFTALGAPAGATARPAASSVATAPAGAGVTGTVGSTAGSGVSKAVPPEPVPVCACDADGNATSAANARPIAASIAACTGMRLAYNGLTPSLVPTGLAVGLALESAL